MGYRIDYQGMKKIRHAEKRRSRRLALTGLMFLMFLCLTHTFWPEGWHCLERALLTGDTAVTAAALESLSEELKGGEDILEALQRFCRSILEGA